MTQDTAPIDDAIAAWTAAWCTRDTDAILTLWDNQDSDATYLPAERTEPLIGGAAVKHYIETVCTLFNPVRQRAENTVSRRLSNDTGLAFYALAWMFTDHRGPIGGTCRVTALWRRKGETLRLFHYAEAPLAPLLELQDFYEKVGADGLDAIPRRANSL